MTLSTFRDHAMKKGMWAGSLKPVSIPDLIGIVETENKESGRVELNETVEPDETVEPPGEGSERPPAVKVVVIKRDHTPALLKIADEIITNASDHAKGLEGGPPGRRVTAIAIAFDKESGQIEVFNDGPGFAVRPNPAASAAAGRPVYEPEVAFTCFLAGSNIDKELSNVKGGINGLGATLAAVHSLTLVVDTTDGVRRLHYRQTIRDRLGVVDPPAVTDLRVRGHGLAAADAAPHTRVVFTPAYAALGYALGPPTPAAPHGTLAGADADDLDAYLRLRAHQVAAYLGPRVAVAYGRPGSAAGARCRTTDAAALGRLLLTPLGDEADAAVVLSARARAAEEPYRSHPWDLAVVILPPGLKAGRRAAAQNMMIVNGVLSNKGSHVKYLKQMLSAAVEEKLRKATKQRSGAAAKVKTAGAKPKADAPMSVAETLGGVRLVMCGAVPGADWGGQRKDELQVPLETLRRYGLPAEFLKRVGAAAAERILIAQGAKSTRVAHEKYKPAHNAGKAALKRHTCLLAAEGDSALQLLRAGLTQTKGRGGVAPGGPSFDWCGTISLQGVIVNAAREVTEVETSGGGTINVRSAKLQANKRLAALADAFGLRYDCAYATPEELATLRYGKLLICVDQDLDGTGKIAGLVLVWLYLFWPALIRAGRVGRFVTPVVRVYPKRAGAPLEFYYEEELARWLAANPGWKKTHHKPKFYKGLAAHTEEEVGPMFAPEAFARAIRLYTLDEGAADLFRVYFGPDPALRKAALVTPVAHLSCEESLALHRSRTIPVGRVQLDIDTKAYKNDAIKRQIPGAVDGLNPARRKILMGAVARFAGEAASKDLKVFQLGGAVADRMFYHHGDASLNGTIIYMAQAFPGARRYPYLAGVGQFGSRHGDPAGSARYIGVRLSPLVKTVFPPADRWHLPYVFEDGQRAEPQYLVPVVPMAVLESYKIVSEGWNHNSFGRDLEATLAVVRAYIGGEPALLEAADRLHAEGHAALPDIERLAAAWGPRASQHGFDGEVRHYRGVPHSFGVYSWDAARREITVTELPIGVVTSSYLEALSKPGRGGQANPRAAHIENIEDRCSPTKVEIVIRLKEGAFETIVEAFGDASIDPIEDAFLLRASLRPHLNYYSAAGGVLEFGECYLAAVLYWAPLRRALYLERLTREKIVAELFVLEETEIIRYIGIAAQLDLSRLEDDEAAAAVLRGRGFPPLHKALLHGPEYTPNAQLRELVTNGPGADHGYILDLKERDLVQSAVAKRQKKLEGLRADLARVEAQLAERPIPGGSVWLAEVEAFAAYAAHAANAANAASPRTQ